MNRTERIQCDCSICKKNAAKIGQSFPLVAMCNPLTLDTMGRTPQTIHGLVHLAYDPAFPAAFRAKHPALPHDAVSWSLLPMGWVGIYGDYTIQESDNEAAPWCVSDADGEVIGAYKTRAAAVAAVKAAA